MDGLEVGLNAHLLFDLFDDGGNLAVVHCGGNDEEVGGGNDLAYFLHHDVACLLGVGGLCGDKRALAGGFHVYHDLSGHFISLLSVCCRIEAPRGRDVPRSESQPIILLHTGRRRIVSAKTAQKQRGWGAQSARFPLLRCARYAFRTGGVWAALLSAAYPTVLRLWRRRARPPRRWGPAVYIRLKMLTSSLW